MSAVDDILLRLLMVAGSCVVMVLLLTWYICDSDAG